MQAIVLALQFCFSSKEVSCFIFLFCYWVDFYEKVDFQYQNLFQAISIF